MRKHATAGVVGAGTMGAGIAQKLAQEGLAVVLVDVDGEKALAGHARVKASLDEAVGRKIMDRARADQTLARVTATADWSKLAPCDLVIEAVFEDLEVKKKVFARLDEHTRPEAILATNTSSLFVRDVANVTKDPTRVLGLHYFFHPAKNRLVEVVPHDATDPARLAEAWALQERIGKTPIASRDAPGFVVNRFFVPWLDEATRLLEEGQASIPSVEAAAKALFGIGMGPFELMNVTGLPIALHSEATLGRELGQGYAPSARLAAQVASGKPWDLSGSPVDDEVARARDRLLGTALLAAAELVESGVGTIEDTDLGARVGLRWRVGPFELASEVGLPAALEAVRGAASRRNRVVPKLIETAARDAKPFVLERVRLDVQGELGVITLDRPDALNALDVTMVERLKARFDEAEANPALQGVVIRGRGKAFAAGADVKWFVRQLEKGDLDAIVRFTEAGQRLFARFQKSRLVVVAALEGLSLGGGTELALACDRIVATARGTIGFPETGIGIYPGLGGTQRLPRRVGRGFARYLVYSGRTLGAEEARQVHAVDEVVAPDEVLERARALVAAGKPTPPRTADPDRFPPALRMLSAAFDVPAEFVAAGRVGLPEDPAVKKDLERMQRRAPLAMKIADWLVRDAAFLPIEQGIERELSQLKTIFSSRDAREGLGALVAGRRPVFTGDGAAAWLPPPATTARTRLAPLAHHGHDHGHAH